MAVKQNRRLLQYAVARAVESWLGLQPTHRERKKLGKLNSEEVEDLCRRARIDVDDGPTKEAPWKEICEKLEEMRNGGGGDGGGDGGGGDGGGGDGEGGDTGLKRDRSSGAQSNRNDSKRWHGDAEAEAAAPPAGGSS